MLNKNKTILLQFFSSTIDIDLHYVYDPYIVQNVVVFKVMYTNYIL